MTRENAVKRLELAEPHGERVPATIRGHVIGEVIGRDERGWLVDYPHNPHGPLAALATVTLTASTRAVLLVFERERADRPIIVGIVQTSEPLLSLDGPAMDQPLVTKVDGKRVVLEAEDELELRCGKASIILRRNGRVVIRGSYVESDATGVNRIRGAAVRVN